MRTLAIIGLLIITTGECFSQSRQDSVTADKKKTDSLIQELKKKLGPKKYYFLREDFNDKDISFSVPKKILKDSTFEIGIKYKDWDIFSYEVNSKDYRFTGHIWDLR